MTKTMTNEQAQLKPCPHCGGGVSIVKINGKWLIDCPTCERHAWEADVPCKYPGKEGLIEWWNTRYKRTCKIVCASRPNGAEGLGNFGVCSECGGTIEVVDQFSPRWKEADKFCRSCGAEVADA